MSIFLEDNFINISSRNLNEEIKNINEMISLSEISYNNICIQGIKEEYESFNETAILNENTPKWLETIKNFLKRIFNFIKTTISKIISKFKEIIMKILSKLKNKKTDKKIDKIDKMYSEVSNISLNKIDSEIKKYQIENKNENDYKIKKLNQYSKIKRRITNNEKEFEIDFNTLNFLYNIKFVNKKSNIIQYDLLKRIDNIISLTINLFHKVNNPKFIQIEEFDEKFYKEKNALLEMINEFKDNFSKKEIFKINDTNLSKGIKKNSINLFDFKLINELKEDINGTEGLSNTIKNEISKAEKELKNIESLANKKEISEKEKEDLNNQRNYLENYSKSLKIQTELINLTLELDQIKLRILNNGLNKINEVINYLTIDEN